MTLTFPISARFQYIGFYLVHSQIQRVSFTHSLDNKEVLDPVSGEIEHKVKGGNIGYVTGFLLKTFFDMMILFLLFFLGTETNWI